MVNFGYCSSVIGATVLICYREEEFPTSIFSQSICFNLRDDQKMMFNRIPVCQHITNQQSVEKCILCWYKVLSSSQDS